MIKVQNGAATREELPFFLDGLEPVSLLDLSWTDPALGVSNAGWWPEDNQSPVLGRYEIYGPETLTPDFSRKVVVSKKTVLPMPQDQINAVKNAQWDIVRTERNSKLAASDWTQLADSPLPDEKKVDWAVYRQSLRDVTSQTDPFDIVWPTSPN